MVSKRGLTKRIANSILNEGVIFLPLADQTGDDPAGSVETEMGIRMVYPISRLVGTD